MDRRSVVVDEALAEELQRGEQRKERSSRVTAAPPARKSAASTFHESKENPIEPDPNPKKRWSATDAGPEAQIRVPRGKWVLTKVQRCPAPWQQ